MTIDPGWYIPTKQTSIGRQKPRWVLAANGEHILYGTGGGLHRECKVKTFKQWMRRTEAERKSQT